MSIIPISIPPKKLAQSITSTDASFKVNNIEGWDGVDLVAGDLGSQHFVTFVNDTKTLMEIMEIDPATIASTSITILKRGLEFDGTESEVTANKLNWPANETTIYFGTNAPQLLNNFIDKSREQTMTGLKTVPTPTADGHIANKAYVLSVVNGGAVSHDRIIVAGNAGETVAAGNLVYFDDTDNEWKLCDADTAASVNVTLLGIAQGAGVNGGAISGGVLIKGIDSNQSGLTTGALYYAGNTAGGISSSTGTTERVVGFARSTTDLYFDPYFYYIPTALQKLALAGLDGTLSSTNKYATGTALQKQSASFAADAEVTDTYVITLSPVPSAYTTGMRISFTANTANTGAATINVNSLGAKTIKKLKNVDLVTGDIKAGQVVEAVYDGTNFQMVSQPCSPTKLYIDDTISVADQNETAVASVTVPANLLGTNGAVRFRAYITSITDGTLTVKCKFGATTLVTDTWTTVNTTGKKGVIEFLLQNAGATNSQVGTYYKLITQEGNDSIDLREDFKIATGTSAIDSTADATLAVTVQWTDASDTFTAYGITVEVVI